MTLVSTPGKFLHAHSNNERQGTEKVEPTPGRELQMPPKECQTNVTRLTKYSYSV